MHCCFFLHTCKKNPTPVLFICFSTASSHVYHPVFTPLHPSILFCQIVFQLYPATPGEPKISIFCYLSLSRHGTGSSSCSRARGCRETSPGTGDPHAVPGTFSLTAQAADATSPNRPGSRRLLGKGGVIGAPVPGLRLKARSRRGSVTATAEPRPCRPSSAPARSCSSPCSCSACPSARRTMRRLLSKMLSRSTPRSAPA